jgi:hypothetical protein
MAIAGTFPNSKGIYMKTQVNPKAHYPPFDKAIGHPFTNRPTKWHLIPPH